MRRCGTVRSGSSDLVTKRSENQDSKLMRAVHIIGVSLDLGGNRRGVDMGPSAFRIAGLGERLAALGATVVDDGDLVAPIPETKSFGDPGKKYIREIAKVCEKLYKTSLAALEKGDFPLVLGGDHSLASGSVAAPADIFARWELLHVLDQFARSSQTELASPVKGGEITIRKDAAFRAVSAPGPGVQKAPAGLAMTGLSFDLRRN